MSARLRGQYGDCNRQPGLCQPRKGRCALEAISESQQHTLPIIVTQVNGRSVRLGFESLVQTQHRAFSLYIRRTCYRSASTWAVPPCRPTASACGQPRYRRSEAETSQSARILGSLPYQNENTRSQRDKIEYKNRRTEIHAKTHEGVDDEKNCH